MTKRCAQCRKAHELGRGTLPAPLIQDGKRLFCGAVCYMRWLANGYGVTYSPFGEQYIKDVGARMDAMALAREKWR